jgi:MFS family permease
VYTSFAVFWIARVCSTVAFHVQNVAIGWQLYSLTGSALDLGLVGLAQFVPMIGLTLVVGQVADRFPRRIIACVCQAVMAVAAVTLACGSAGGWTSRATILAIVVGVGAARAFENPTMAAMVPGLVPHPMIPRAIAAAASANQTAQILGPAVGGFLYAAGATVPYATAAALFVLACVLMSLLRPAQAPALRDAVTLESVFSGLVFIRSSPVLLGTMTLDLFAVLVGGVTALLPIVARDVLGTGPWGLGLLRSAPAVGALAMSIVLARYPLERGVGRALFRVIFVFGAATLVVGVSRHLLLSLAALVVLGAADLISVVIRVSLVQMRTPDAMRGRVSAAHSLFTGTSNQLGEFRAGAVAALLGVVPAVLLGGVGTIAVAVLWMVLFPGLKRIGPMER